MTLQGDGFRTRNVCAYNPCGNVRLISGTTYQQHKRYLVNIKNDLTCPQQQFREDLIKLLTKWRNKGDRLIVCKDTNENICKKSIGRALTDKEGLCMVEVVGEITGQKIGLTLFRGSSPIDGIWATADLNVTHACVMPAGYSIGDHCMFVIDFQEQSLIGKTPSRVKQFSFRRLNLNVLAAAPQKYISLLEDNLA
jgi:hypothetical protein